MLMLTLTLLLTVALASGNSGSDDTYNYRLARNERNSLPVFGKTIADDAKYGKRAVNDRKRTNSDNDHAIEWDLEAVAKENYYAYKLNRMKTDVDTAHDHWRGFSCYIDAEELQFLLYTGKNKYVVLNFTEIPSELKPNVQTKMYIPDRNENPTVSGSKLAAEYFKNGPSQLNLIVVNWKKYYDCPMKMLMDETLPDVGFYVSAMITYLAKNQMLDTDQLHFIANKIGLHVVEEVVRNTDQSYARVTALDPCHTLMEQISTVRSNGQNSVQFVDVIFINLEAYPRLGRIPHALFFPNGGYNVLKVAYENQALNYYVKSINEPETFTLTKCSRLLRYYLGLCDQNPTNYMGEHVKQDVRGTFFSLSGPDELAKSAVKDMYVRIQKYNGNIQQWDQLRNIK